MPSRPVLAGLAAPALLLVFAGCGREPELTTQTFPLQYIDASMATQMIDPYVFVDRPGAPGRASATAGTLTVRETPDNLAKIARVLAEYDKPRPWVRLHFQIIAADGAGAADERIAEVEQELRQLFRFEGYRLVDETFVSGSAQSGIVQQVGDNDTGYYISVDIGDVRDIGDSGLVELQVELRSPFGPGLRTSINARAGRIVVLGNAQMGSGTGTTILTVRPELVRN